MVKRVSPPADQESSSDRHEHHRVDREEPARRRDAGWGLALGTKRQEGHTISAVHGGPIRAAHDLEVGPERQGEPSRGQDPDDPDQMSEALRACRASSRWLERDDRRLPVRHPPAIGRSVTLGSRHARPLGTERP